MVSTRSKKALPHELVVDIVGLVAATSPQPIADLNSIRATCKAMHAASKERHVGRNVALEKEKVMKWCENDRYLAVLENLAGAGNPEACFLVGLKLVFADHNNQPGLAFLEQAATAGHKTAAYVLGLLLYTAEQDMRDAAKAKHYISQLEGDAASETKKRTNRECIRLRRLATGAVREVTWKKIAGPPAGQQAAPVMPEEDGHRCTSKGCGLPEEWAEYSVFCNDGCRIRHECTNFFTQVFNYLP